MDRKAWWVTVHGFRRAGHDWACTQTHTSCLYTPLGHLDKHSEKHVYEFVFLANILHLVFICEVICSKKETPPVCVDPRVKPSRMLESRCSQVALFLCHTGNSTYSNVFIQCFYKNVFIQKNVHLLILSEVSIYSIQLSHCLKSLSHLEKIISIPLEASALPFLGTVV